MYTKKHVRFHKFKTADGKKRDELAEVAVLKGRHSHRGAKAGLLVGSQKKMHQCVESPSGWYRNIADSGFPPRFFSTTPILNATLPSICTET